MTVYQLLGSQANIRSLIFLKLEWWRQCNTHHLTLHFIHHVRGSCLCINVVILDRYKCMSKFTLRMHARTLFCSTLTILLSAWIIINLLQVFGWTLAQTAAKGRDFCRLKKDFSTKVRLQPVTKYLKTFNCFSIVSLYHKWDRARLLSSETGCTICLISF